MMNCRGSMLEKINYQLNYPSMKDKLVEFLINQVIDAAFCVRNNGDFIYANKSMSVITEYSHQELLSMNLSNLDIDFSLNKWLQKWENLKNVEGLSWKSRYRTKGGRTFVATIDFAYIQLQESEFCYGVIKENTQELVPILCHEFRTPLSKSITKDVEKTTPIVSCLHPKRHKFHQFTQIFNYFSLGLVTG
ncbi:PAS domain S-box protein [Cylindrospermopsis raciborskii]|uniref:PAS domain S-box protein n=1 Tax=Cylindrospermopsis raciborskii TaxID=77022 RepID=UPI0038D2133C